ncbi:MAG: DUF4340 domain-containing protein [Clostridiales bacterium]|nr:DUF4340 domain-containing protein [Clostridiales bacterium]
MKRGVTLLICLVLLGGLIGAYFYLGGRPADDTAASETPSKTVNLIDKQKWDIQSVRFVSKDNDVTILPVILPTPAPTSQPAPVETSPDNSPSSAPPASSPTPTPNISFTVSGFEDAVIDKTVVDNMARMAYSLDAAEKVADNGDPKAFRLDPPDGEINIKYTDGTEKTVYVGMQSPAKDYYYIMVKGDPAVYMVYSTTGERAFYGMDKILSKALTAVTADTLQYVYVKQKDKDAIEFAYDGEPEELAAAIEQYGAVTLYMVQPYKGWELYNSNFKTYVLDGMDGINIGGLVEARPEDYAAYGLDDPSLTVWLKDAAAEIHLEIGDDADRADVTDADENKTYVYVKFYDRPSVYVMDKSYLTTLYDINPFGFTMRFVSLHNIDDVVSFTIKSVSRNYDAVLNHELIYVTATPAPTFTPTPTPDPDVPAPSDTAPASEDANTSPAPTPTPEKLIHPRVNGQEVQDKAFRTFYQAVIGLSYDTGIDTFTPTGLPEITISYKLNNGEPDVVTRYYKYNNDFYAVRKDDDPIQFVVGKQYVDAMFKSAEDLLAGKLDK